MAKTVGQAIQSTYIDSSEQLQKLTKPLYCPFCKIDIDNYTELTWNGNVAVNKSGERLILCSHLYHGESLKLSNGMNVKGDSSNALVHLDECLKYCRRDPAYCPHDIWHKTT